MDKKPVVWYRMCEQHKDVTEDRFANVAIAVNVMEDNKNNVRFSLRYAILADRKNSHIALGHKSDMQQC
ncbi:unnamed protein product [Peronospora destructor]|uniref:Uncharacterized protein n=1 Tax=Peronospora destructor TaxID=86335 RepID=A0AAV0V598_9STRA|nr:unnamed protein product [Peronospora destructor]